MTYENHPVPSDAQSNEYATPRWLTRELAETLPTPTEKFDLDPASGAEDEPHAVETYTKADDGLETPWYGWVWCNPPWSSPSNDGRMKEAWLSRAVEQVERAAVEGVMMLLPDDVSTGWFREYVTTADYLTFTGRIKFEDVGRNPSYGCQVIVWGEPPAETLEALKGIGPTYPSPL